MLLTQLRVVKHLEWLKRVSSCSKEKLSQRKIILKMLGVSIYQK